MTKVKQKSNKENASRTFESYSTKRVSYILTTKNKAKFLQKALENYRKLVKEEDELIIIDGASRDNTLEIVGKYKDFVTTFVSEPDSGVAHAFNKGILLSRGKYIKNINDDDTIYPAEMEKAIKIMQANPDIDLLVCGGTKQFGRNLSEFYFPPGVNYGKSVTDVFNYGACGVGFVIRRSSLAKIGPTPVTLSSDTHIVLEFIDKGANVKFCRLNLFNHPIYKHSTIRARAREIERDGFRLMKFYCGNRFYFRYRLKRASDVFLGKTYLWLKQHSLLYSLLVPLRILNQILIVKRKAKNSKIKHAWDGGFS